MARVGRAQRAARAAAPLRVPAGPIVEHLAALRAAGLGIPRIAKVSGISSRHVFHVASGAGGAWILKDTADALLAVTPADSLTVPAVGAARRICALNADGYSMAALDRALGWRPGICVDLAARHRASAAVRCSRDRHNALAALYARLEQELPPAGGRAAEARTKAERAGYAPRAAWTPATIDDPAARPWDGIADGTAAGEHRDVTVIVERLRAGVWRGHLPPPLRAAVAAELWRLGYVDGQVAELLRVHIRTVQRMWRARTAASRVTRRPRAATLADYLRYLGESAHDRHRNARSDVARANAATSIADVRIAAELAAGAHPGDVDPVAGGRTKAAMREALAAAAAAA